MTAVTVAALAAEQKAELDSAGREWQLDALREIRNERLAEAERLRLDAWECYHRAAAVLSRAPRQLGD